MLPPSNDETYSDFIVYVDESGDHDLRARDAQYPIFVLVFCVFRKDHYCLRVVPALQAFKFRQFGHDMVLLHERQIRKAEPPFEFLVDAARRDHFHRDLTSVIGGMPVTLFASVIQKTRLRERYSSPRNPYHLALRFGLERISAFLALQGQQDRVTHVVCEKRGRREDEELASEFRRVCQGANFNGQHFPFRPILADKQTLSAGLQLADLVARPIGRRILNPAQANRAFEVIDQKLYRKEGRLEGWGLKIFP